ncbi:MAG: hypothetical protein FWD78_14110, partial [Treponema sp.]|nr:hypothetical protein [Treponema sp.]
SLPFDRLVPILPPDSSYKGDISIERRGTFLLNGNRGHFYCTATRIEKAIVETGIFLYTKNLS